MDAKAEFVHKILEGEKQYVVPHFQRRYSWEEKHWTDLWNDISELLENKGRKDHFIGAFVCMVGKHAPDRVPDYLLIDGQQRLLTLTIMLCVLRDIAKKNNLQEKADEIQTKYLVDKFKKGLERYKIISRSEDRDFLFRLLDNEPRKGESRIMDAYDFFEKRILDLLENAGAMQKQDEIESLSRAITKQVSLVMITLNDDENPFAIFETLNVRGLSLAESDLIRNHVFMQLKLDQQDKFDADRWTPFEKLFTKSAQFEEIDKTDFYRDYLMVDGTYVRSNEVYFSFKQRKGSKPVEQLVAELEQYAKPYLWIRRPTTTDQPRIKDMLSRFDMLGIGTARPLVLHLLEKFDRGQLPLGELVACLEHLESFAVRRSVCGESTRGYNYFFPRVVRELGSNAQTSIVKVLQDYGWPSDAQFKDSLLKFSIYEREKEKALLILQSLERRHGHKERVDLSTLNMEHVMPQVLTDEWRGMLGTEWERIHETYLHTIGNLTLTGYNPEMSNKPFAAKKKDLSNSKLELNKYFTDVATWDEVAIRGRAERLASDIASIFARPH